jgi:hypothetical protein
VGMRHIFTVVGLLAGTALAAPGEVEALCVCGDFGNCSSAIACEGKNPSDACSPPRKATCKIVQGNGNGVTCCCGCSRGRGPLSCLYTPVADRLADLDAAVCGEAAGAAGPAGSSCSCPSRSLDRQAKKIVKRAGRALRGADQACRKGRDHRKKVRAANEHVSGLKKRINRAVAKNDITAACGDQLTWLVDDVLSDITDAGQGGPSVTTTTTTAGSTTTSTTQPSGPSCDASFHVVPGFPFEREFRISCTGGSASLNGFGVKLDPGFQITNELDPNGFACQIQSQLSTNDWLWCAGSFGFGDVVTGGRIATLPPPSQPGFGAGLTISTTGGDDFGPFRFAF